MPANPPTVPDQVLLGQIVLVQAAQAGDRSAFGALHEQFAKVVRGVLMARSGIVDLDDLEQEVFAQALEHLRQLRSPAAFGPWILQIARRVASRHHARPRHEVLAEELRVHDSPRAEALWVLDRIRSLPECFSEPLILRLVLGMSGEEIAQRLGYAPGSIRVNLHRGMAKLRALLNTDAGGAL